MRYWPRGVVAKFDLRNAAPLPVMPGQIDSGRLYETQLLHHIQVVLGSRVSFRGKGLVVWLSTRTKRVKESRYSRRTTSGASAPDEYDLGEVPEPEMQAQAQANQRSQMICGVTQQNWTAHRFSMHQLSRCEGLCDSIFDHGYRG